MIDRLSAGEPKTKPFAGLANAFQVSRKAIIVLEGDSPALIKSLRNLALFELCHAENLNAFDVLNAHKVLVTKLAFEPLEQRVTATNAASN
mgnify:CR=1 FL=1